MGSLTFYQLYLKSLHISLCFKYGSQQLVISNGFHVGVGSGIACFCSLFSVLLFEAGMFVLRPVAWLLPWVFPHCPLGLDLLLPLAFFEWILPLSLIPPLLF